MEWLVHNSVVHCLVHNSVVVWLVHNFVVHYLVRNSVVRTLAARSPAVARTMDSLLQQRSDLVQSQADTPRMEQTFSTTNGNRKE